MNNDRDLLVINREDYLAGMLRELRGLADPARHGLVIHFLDLAMAEMAEIAERTKEAPPTNLVPIGSSLGARVRSAAGG
jgi:predicted alpha/beta hydrolase